MNVNPFTMNTNVTIKQRTKLLSAQEMTFDSYSKQYNIFGDIHRLSLVEKAKMMTIIVERTNRLKNLKKFKHCFIEFCVHHCLFCIIYNYIVYHISECKLIYKRICTGW